ncbi:DUF2796 domain-containing protein [uncultured Sulfitobacter sp.]|uniref:zinc uptake protein ZrgA n=1 Tax=uncultured Sulfitobacter sp. TaxID=191468 RepID=UPI0026362CDF|nr:DUF2796 domain-containing protein [uncultured Sulfitobacter sp.]
MHRLAPAALVLLAAGAASAEETRQLDAHEHGVGQLNIAFDGDQIAMELHAPGADIVGFEYEAKTAEDRAKVDAAVATLARPLDLFALPATAGCSVVQASASLESEEDHDDHGHEDHADDHDDHDHAKHGEEGHTDEDHAAHQKDHDHDHDDHGKEANHTEFHAEYLLNCAVPAQATLVTFAYFDSFPNALELEVQVVSDRGATAFEVVRDAPTLDLRDMF